jgi:hypothetical protein
VVGAFELTSSECILGGPPNPKDPERWPYTMEATALKGVPRPMPSVSTVWSRRRASP